MPTVAIIGASRGIGREFVRQYLDAGWTVHATARRESEIAALAEAGAASALADTTDEASLKAFAASIAGELDLVIINAGVSTRRYERQLGDVDSAEWERVMRVNALGPLLVSRALADKLKRPGGALVAISSKMGSIGGDSGSAAYSYRMSKSALNMAMTRLAGELQGGVAVAVLHPGWVKTDMGGADAPVEIEDSVTGMRRVIAGLGAAVECVFVDYEGNAIPW